MCKVLGSIPQHCQKVVYGLKMQLSGKVLAWHVQGPGFIPSLTKISQKKGRKKGVKQLDKKPRGYCTDTLKIATNWVFMFQGIRDTADY